jgi:hypothetical protein
VFLSQLGDTSITSPSADQILVYGQPVGGEPGVNVWYNKTHNFLTTSTALDDLSNVIISLQTSGDILRYNGTNWVNVPFSNLENDTLDSVTDRGSTTTNSINVGGVTTDYVQFDTAVTLDGDESQGYMAWNADVDTVSVYPYDSQWFNIGQDMHWHVKNGTPHTIERGQVLMATGAVGNSGKIEVGLMVADGTIDAKYIIGVAIRDIASGEFGKASTQGIIRGINTSTFQEGSVLWCDPDTAGGLTATEPTAPDLRLPVAFVVSSGNNGAIAVRIVQGNQLHELHDVRVVSPANTDILRYSTVTNRWENWTPDYISGYTESDPIFTASPANGIASTDITNWNTAYGWGNHATAGYLTGLPAHTHDDRYYTETEIGKFFDGTTAITGYNRVNWNTAYGWGNHASAGYLTSLPAHTHDIADIINLQDALDSKLDSESDPIYTASSWYTTTNNSANWDTAYGWGNHASAGYLTAESQELSWDINGKTLSITPGNTITLDGLASITEVEGYGYITGYTETDTLDSVTDRGATTSNDVTVGGLTANGDTITFLNESAGNKNINIRKRFDASSFINWIRSSNTDAYMGVDASENFQIGYASSGLNRSLIFTSNNSEVIRFDVSGNVGIGTTNPSYALDIERTTGEVAIQLQARDNSSNTAIYFGDNGDADVGSLIYNQGSNYMSFTTNAGERMRITSGGNVGIGTTSPGAKLDVVNSGNEIARFKSSATGSPYVSFWQDTTRRSYLQQLNSVNVLAIASEYGPITFYTDSTGAEVERMRIDASGNVGIGTTSPSRKLHVVGSEWDNTGGGGVIFENSNTVGASLTLKPSSSAVTYGRSGWAVYAGGPGAAIGDGNLGFWAHETNEARMVIQRGGNVGIGTTSPGQKLDVVGTIKAGIAGNSSANIPALLVTSSGTGDAQAAIAIQQATTEGDTIIFADYEPYVEWGISTENAANKIQFTGGVSTGSLGSKTLYNNAGTARTAYIKFEHDLASGQTLIGGNVGIGTTSPTNKIDVAGAIKIDSDGTYGAGYGAIGFGGLTNGYNRIFGRTNTGDGLFIASATGRGIYFRAGGGATDHMSVTSDGNVGIATNSPSYKLDVNGTIRGGTSYRTSIDGNASGAAIYFGSAGDIDSLGIVGAYASLFNISSGNGDISFQFNNTERMRITTGGNVGIGSTAPAAKLNVASTGANAYSSTITKGTNMKGIINVLSNNADDMVGIYFGTGTTTEGTHWSGITGSRSQSATDWSTQLNFYTHDETLSNITNATQKMVIKGSGNVGIGTTSPAAKLHVNGEGIFEDYITLGVNNTDGKAAIYFDESSSASRATSAMYVSYDGTNVSGDNNRLSLGSLKSGVGDIVNVMYGGNVGIGTSSPSYKLDVNGSFNATSVNVTNDITTSAGNLVVQNGAGIYSIKSTIGTSTSGTAFRIANTNGVQAARATFVAETANYQVAKIYEVVKAGNGDPVAFKVVDTGPSGEEDFSVSFSNDGGDLLCTVTNDSANESLTLITTIFVGGSNTSQTVSNS